MYKKKIYFSNFVKLVSLIFTVIACSPDLPDPKKIVPGTYSGSVELTFRGFKRDFLIHFPNGYSSSKPYPLVMAIHGAFSSATEFEKVSGFSTLADDEGFIVVYPNGIGIFGFLRHWNAGYCCAYAAESQNDDVGYLKLILDSLMEKLPIDRNRIFLSGFSNGGMMAYRFAAEFPEYVAAIAAVSTTIGSKNVDAEKEWKLQKPKIPVSVLIAHGLADESIPYIGGLRPGSSKAIAFHAVDQSVEFWLKTNRCNQNAVFRSQVNNMVEVKTWTECSDGSLVKLYSIQEWNHRWPGIHHTGKLPVDNQLNKFDLTKIIWDFFQIQTD